jgi:hypothetical protein
MMARGGNPPGVSAQSGIQILALLRRAGLPEKDIQMVEDLLGTLETEVATDVFDLTAEALSAFLEILDKLRYSDRKTGKTEFQEFVQLILNKRDSLRGI